MPKIRHQPRYHFYRSAVLPAPLNDVWREMRSFARTLKIAFREQVETINWCDGGSTDKIPSLIQFTVQPGGQKIIEEVIGRDEMEHSLTYRTVEQALNIVDYVASYTLKPITDEPDQTFLEWTRDFSLTEDTEPQAFLSFYSASSEQQLANVKAHFKRINFPPPPR